MEHPPRRPCRFAAPAHPRCGEVARCRPCDPRLLARPPTKIFSFIDIETWLVIQRTVNGGQGIDPSRLFTCEFVLEDVPVPGLPGLRDLRLIVQGLATPQGPPGG
jgi:hypothetical protein